MRSSAGCKCRKRCPPWQSARDGVLVRGEVLRVRSPIDGSELASIPEAGPDDVADAVRSAAEAFAVWRTVPAPRRGELVQRIGQRLRDHKRDLAALVSWEVGKITQEVAG